MERPLLPSAWLALLALALAATAAPLPFPRASSALKPFQGEWGVSEMAVDAAAS